MEQGLRFFLLVLILKDTYSTLDHVQWCLLCLRRSTGSGRRQRAWPPGMSLLCPLSPLWWRGRKQTRLWVTRAGAQHLSSFLNTGSYSLCLLIWWEMSLSLKASFESPNKKQVWSFFYCFFISIEMVPESVHLHDACRPLTSCRSCGRERLGFPTCGRASSPGGMRAFAQAGWLGVCGVTDCRSRARAAPTCSVRPGRRAESTVKPRGGRGARRALLRTPGKEGCTGCAWRVGGQVWVLVSGPRPEAARSPALASLPRVRGESQSVPPAPGDPTAQVPLGPGRLDHLLPACRFSQGGCWHLPGRRAGWPCAKHV